MIRLATQTGRLLSHGTMRSSILGQLGASVFAGSGLTALAQPHQRPLEPLAPFSPDTQLLTLPGRHGRARASTGSAACRGLGSAVDPAARREGNESDVATIHPWVTFYAARFGAYSTVVALQ